MIHVHFTWKTFKQLAFFSQVSKNIIHSLWIFIFASTNISIVVDQQNFSVILFEEGTYIFSFRKTKGPTWIKIETTQNKNNLGFCTIGLYKKFTK